MESQEANKNNKTLKIGGSWGPPKLQKGFFGGEAQLNAKMKDENNQAPLFNNIESGKVLEHEAPGTAVMQVSDIDNDGTYPR